MIRVVHPFRCYQVTMKVAGLGGFADLTGKYRFLLSAWMMSLTVELGTIGPNW